MIKELKKKKERKRWDQFFMNEIINPPVTKTKLIICRLKGRVSY
jgi:hypothetical protein